jgi:hypothetical protein
MAYYKLFSSAFDARNFFAARKAPYLQHEWQIEMGGPIIKNRTLVYDGFSQRIPLGSFATATVPTAAHPSLKRTYACTIVQWPELPMCAQARSKTARRTGQLGHCCEPNGYSALNNGKSV